METKANKIIRNKISISSLGIGGILYIFLGITLLLYQKNLTNIFLAIIFLLGLFISLSELTRYIFKFQILKIIKAFLPFSYSLIFIFLRDDLANLYALCMGLYFIIISLIFLIDYILLKNNKIKGAIYRLVQALFTLLIALPLLLNNLKFENALFYSALFSFFYGLGLFFDFLRQLFPRKYESYKKRFKVNLPIIFTALMPRNAINYVNRLLLNDDDGILQEESYLKDEKPNFQILIHVTEKGFGTIGHADFCFNDKIYCYGNYDHESLKLFKTVGDGVFYTVDSMKEYIEFRKINMQGSLIAFGLKLCDDDLSKIQKSIDELYTHLYPWQSNYEKYINNIKEFDVVPKDYASELYRVTNASMYKFKDTSFKTYFVFSTNCVKLVNRMIRSSGIDAINPNGILTPGSFYEYFNYLYRLKNSIVVSKKTYHFQNKIEHNVKE